MKAKHSKFKNTGILFELLVRQIASDVLSAKDSSSVRIIKKFFSNSELAKEHKLYYTILSAEKLNESKAESLINTVIDLSTKLDREQINREKYNLIKEIKKIKRGKTVWSSKTVQTETREIRSEWTTEMSYDIAQYSGIDSSIEEELINTLLKELGNDRA